MDSRPRWWRNERVRLSFLGLLLVALIARFGDQIGVLDFGGSSGPSVAVAGDCPAEGAPAVVEVDRGQILDLREDIRRLVYFDTSIRAYEQGPVGSGVAWTDGEPGWNPDPPPGTPLPGGYEMRWWMPSGDDVVADALLFIDAAQAGDYLRRASSGDCRTASVTRAALMPAGARNLSWSNPEAVAQEDVLVQSGRRVYRVAVVRPQAGTRIGAVARREAFSLVNALACALPGVDCQESLSSFSAGAAAPRGRLSNN